MFSGNERIGRLVYLLVGGGLALAAGVARKPLQRAALQAGGSLDKLYARLRDTFGDPGVPALGTGPIKPAQAWESRNIVPVRLHTGKTVRLHRKVAADFARTFQEATQASGWTPKSVQTYVPRYMKGAGKKPMSLHTLGVAVDFDPGQNVRRKGAASSIHDHPAFIDTFERNGWIWGGRWGAAYDPMHFEKREA